MKANNRLLIMYNLTLINIYGSQIIDILIELVIL